MTLPHDAMVWSVMCDWVISWSYSPFFRLFVYCDGRTAIVIYSMVHLRAATIDTISLNLKHLAESLVVVHFMPQNTQKLKRQTVCNKMLSVNAEIVSSECKNRYNVSSVF